MKKGFDGDVIAKFAGVNGHFLQDTIDTSTDAKDLGASCDVSALVARSIMSLGNSTFQKNDYDAPAIKPSIGGFKSIEEEVKGKFEGKFETPKGPKGTKPKSKNRSKPKTDINSDENILGNKRSSSKVAGPDSKKGPNSKDYSDSTEASKESFVTVNFLMIDRENLRTKKSNNFPTKVSKDPLVCARNKNFEHELKFNLKGILDEDSQKTAILTTFCNHLKSKTFYIFQAVKNVKEEPKSSDGILLTGYDHMNIPTIELLKAMISDPKQSKIPFILSSKIYESDLVHLKGKHGKVDTSSHAIIEELEE